MSAPKKENVWQYPRPPRLEPSSRPVRVEHGGVVVAESSRALRVLETSHPPTYYIPSEDVRMDLLLPQAVTTYCEWKGNAAYFDLVVPGARRSARAAWAYADPRPPYEAIRGCVAFYASRVEACFVGGERVQAQAGDFYGGWITAEIEGPFKGGPGTTGW